MMGTEGICTGKKITSGKALRQARVFFPDKAHLDQEARPLPDLRLQLITELPKNLDEACTNGLPLGLRIAYPLSG